MGPAAALFKLQPLPPAFFPCLLALLLGYAGLTTLVKRWRVRRWVWQ